MQGFNKYYPPDFDPDKHKSLNSYQGKHALGDRARKIDQGVLITRFELPYNIWCLNCNSHIGMGVRYNAEKRKVGMYYSTPIFAFRCKCHLCSGWFEIRTDPKNTRYVVEYGARQKMEDWNPEENGGYAVHDSEAAATPVDPLASLEKTTAAKTLATTVTAPRLEELYDLSDKYNADPYSHSKRTRHFFREEKKVEKAKEAVDNQIKDQFALPKELKLVREEEVAEEAKESWNLKRAQESREKSDKLFPKQTFAQVVQAQIQGRKDSSVERRQKSLSSNRQASTLSAILMRNTLRSTKRQPSDAKSLGIIKR